MSLPFIFPKVSSPASSENEMSLNLSHHIKISFPAWSDYGIPKFHSPLGRITECQNFIPRLVGLQNTKISFPAWSDYGIPKFHSPLGRITEYQNVIPRSIGLRKVKKKRLPLLYRITEKKKKKTSSPTLLDYGISNECLSPVCRITEGHSSSIFLTMSSPSMLDNETSLKFSFLKIAISRFVG